MTVGRKIYALIGLCFIGLLGITILDSRELASSLKQQKQIELQHLTELALGIVKEEHAAAQKGDIAVADAQKRAMARVAALRYGNNDYFWVNDMHAAHGDASDQAGDERQRSVEPTRIRTESCCSSRCVRRRQEERRGLRSL